MILLLPFFVVGSITGDMDLQFTAPKLWGCFLLGNALFARLVAKDIHPALGWAHFAFAASVLFTGFGGVQLYPFAYWTAGLFACLWMCRQEEGHQLFLFKAFALSGLAMAFHAYVQVMGFTWPLTFAEGIEQTHPLAFMGQHTKMGALLAPLTGVAFVLGWYPAAAFMAFVCLLTKSSFTVLALAAGLAIGLRYKIDRSVIALGAILGALVLALLIAYNATLGSTEKLSALEGNGRKQVWAETWKGFADRPLLGHAPGAFYYEFPRQYQTKEIRELWGNFRNPHNDYLLVLFDGGIWGAFALFLLLGALLGAYVKLWWREDFVYEWNKGDLTRVELIQPPKQVLCALSALASLLANALGNFPFILAPHYLLGMVSAAIVLKESSSSATIFAWQPRISLPSLISKLRSR